MKYRGRKARTVPFAENVLSIGTPLPRTVIQAICCTVMSQEGIFLSVGATVF